MYNSCLQGVRPIGAIKSIKLAFAIVFGFVAQHVLHIYCMFVSASSATWR